MWNWRQNPLCESAMSLVHLLLNLDIASMNLEQQQQMSSDFDFEFIWLSLNWDLEWTIFKIVEATYDLDWIFRFSNTFNVQFIIVISYICIQEVFFKSFSNNLILSNLIHENPT